jgi:hypothetical protein
MKRFTLILTIFFLFAPLAFSQITTDAKVIKGTNNLTVVMAGLADTVTPYYSKPFSLLGYDGVDLTSYPLTAGVKLAGTSLVTRRLSCYIQASYDLTNWANVDTISQVDSVNTLILKTGLTLNGYRAPYYRFYVLGGSSANDDTTYDIRLYAWKRE